MVWLSGLSDLGNFVRLVGWDRSGAVSFNVFRQCNLADFW